MMTLIKPNWPAPRNIKAYSTTRSGGVSSGAYCSLNLGNHVNDLPENVLKNRALLKQHAQLPQEPAWLEQIHSIDVVTLEGQPLENNRADAAYSKMANQVCTVMTADCLPVLFCSLEGDEVAAAHAGWRGLCDGVLEETVKHFTTPTSHIMAWLGPAIGPEQFEVGDDVRDAFLQHDSAADNAFNPYKPGKYLANIYQLARQRLHALGITQIYGGDYCTFTDSERFFSYRRDKITGRMASLIWIE